MCWVLYLAADRPLPLRSFDPGSPAFNVTELEGREVAVRSQFSRPFVYALGAHTGCGCGFDRDQANPRHPAELQATEKALEALHAYLREALDMGGTLELFACWDGDQAATPDQRWQRRLVDFHPQMAWFPDRTFIEVTSGVV
jgi:hypothetical protein